MLKTKTKSLSGHALRDAGWAALVSSLGLVNATRYIMQSETGYGDYTKIRKNAVKGKRVADLYKETALFEKKH
ncbi:MAG: hypothetical protein OEW15_18875 [Nitrospirota bacterium]|nr:hypothetical protein [Nitrospirota bacterium]